LILHSAKLIESRINNSIKLFLTSHDFTKGYAAQDILSRDTHSRKRPTAGPLKRNTETTTILKISQKLLIVVTLGRKISYRATTARITTTTHGHVDLLIRIEKTKQNKIQKHDYRSL
jgi:hypothetical protein